MFYTKINLNNEKEMFDYLKNHFTYDTMSSWNEEESIANNVKFYNLNLDGDWSLALSNLEADNYELVNSFLEGFHTDHPNYQVGFNGRSGGYLVLYNDNNWCNILPTEILYSNTYEDFKEEYNDKDLLVRYTELVQDFDMLCDDLRDVANQMSKPDYTYEHIDEQLDRFNYNYEDDFELLNIKPIELINNSYIDITEIMKYKALYTVFEQVLDEIHNLYNCTFDYSTPGYIYIKM